MKIYTKFSNYFQEKNKAIIFYKNCIFKKIFHINRELAIITIAFNKVDLIKKQSELLKKNITDEFSYFVIDNSNSDEDSFRIRDYCLNNKVNYFRIPPNPGSYNPSLSHGFAINWAIKNIILKYKIKNFALLDHDIFIIKKYSILNKLNNQIFYGVKQTKLGIWYLWPGFSFFKVNKLKARLRKNYERELLKTDVCDEVNLYKIIASYMI